MKRSVVIVAGGRDFGNRRAPGMGLDQDWRGKCWRQLDGVLSNMLAPADVIRHGGARGADEMAGEWGEYRNRTIERCEADWEKFGKSAGRIRNEEMTKGARKLIAFWDGQSPGTKHMIDTALKHRLEVHVYRYDPIE